MKTVRPGLSLIEVVLTVLILGIAVTSILGLQGTLMRGVFTGHAFLERIGFIRSYFVIIEKERLYTKKSAQEKVLEDPPLKMRYTHQKPTSKSLASFAHLVVDQIEAEWQTSYGVRRDQFAQLKFRPQKKAQK